MGTIHVNRDGKKYPIDDSITGAQLKSILGAPTESTLINARNQMIGDDEIIRGKVQDGESVAALPNFDYW